MIIKIKRMIIGRKYNKISLTNKHFETTINYSVRIHDFDEDMAFIANRNSNRFIDGVFSASPV